MTRRQGQIIPRGDQRWLVRVSFGRDPETRRRKYRSRTICGSFRSAQHHLNNASSTSATRAGNWPERI